MSSQNIWDTCANDDLEKLSNIINNEGIGVDYEVPNQGTLLMLACKQKAVKCLEFLLQNGANANIKCQSRLAQNTPLHQAVTTGFVLLSELLLQHGANVDVTDGYGRTPLFFAKNPDTLRLLLDNGADVNARDNNGNTALDGYMRGHLATMPQAGLVRFPPHIADRCARELLDRGADASNAQSDTQTVVDLSTTPSVYDVTMDHEKLRARAMEAEIASLRAELARLAANRE